MMTMRMTRKRARLCVNAVLRESVGLCLVGARACQVSARVRTSDSTFTKQFEVRVCRLLSMPAPSASAGFPILILVHQQLPRMEQRRREQQPASSRLSASDAVLRPERPRKALAPASSASQFRAEGTSSERWSKDAAEQGRRGGAGCGPSGGTSALSASQLELYSALFGASETPGWAPASDENNMPVGVGGGCGTEAPPDHAQQIERAVRKAMRGAAVERQQAVAAAVEEAQKAVTAALAAAHAGLEKGKAAAEAAEAAHREAEARHQQATRAAEKEHARAVARAVERAEKAKDVAWQAALEK